MHHALDAFARHPLLFGPSPVHRLDRLTAHLGGAAIWAKRDDCNSGLAFGGNKTRKLEYLVADALAQGCDTLAPTGDIECSHAACDRDRRVSQVSGREGETFSSPLEQRARIEQACERDGLQLLEIIEELDVSGGTPLEQRAGARRALETIEAGDAEILVGAYFDRLFRSLTVQAEIVSRVEAVGGGVLALDTGEVTNGSAGQWLSASVLGLVAEYQRRSTAERTREAQIRAVARGVWMSRYVPTGYYRGEDGRLVPNSDAGLVAEAFTLRASGKSVAEVFEEVRGLGLTYASVGRMLKSRAYLGEVHFGELVNRSAHPPIVDADTWQRAQRAKVLPGRKAKSERLLARLGVLRCASCGGRMSATTGQNGKRAIYRCGGHVGDRCPQRVTIDAGIVEQVVVDKVKAALADVEGRASVEENARDAEVALEHAQSELDALIDLLDPLEPAARRRLDAATALRDRCRERVEHLRGHRALVTVSAARDWDRLSLEARRGLIRATVARVVVAPGRGAGRVTVELVGE
jgi:site-specific DNA recombinase